MRARLFLGLLLVAGALAAFACGGDGFDPQSKVTSVRIFGTRVDKPYARPGETVTLEVLTTDARAAKPRPMRNFWIPTVCLNPREDLYFACFAAAANVQIDGGAAATLRAPFADAGTPAADAVAGPAGGGFASIPAGIDLSPFLPQGSTFSFQMPADAVVAREGIAPYGLAIVFNIACAGQVRIAAITTQNPQQSPIQCTDEDGVPLSSDDYVIGISRVYAYADRVNTNPVVERVTLNGVDVDLAKGITVERCTTPKLGDCPPFEIDVKVPEASWELNPGGAAASPREQIWVTYYSDLGKFKDDARLLYDTKVGRVTESDIEYRAPKETGNGTVWAVVHDNRAGAAFVQFPILVK